MKDDEYQIFIGHIVGVGISGHLRIWFQGPTVMILGQCDSAHI